MRRRDEAWRAAHPDRCRSQNLDDFCLLRQGLAQLEHVAFDTRDRHPAIGIISVNFISPRAIDITARRTKSDRLVPVCSTWEFNFSNSDGLSRNETMCGC